MLLGLLSSGNRVEPDGSHLKCRFTPLSVGNHTFIGKSCVVESAGIGCNVRIDDGCVLVRSDLRTSCRQALMCIEGYQNVTASTLPYMQILCKWSARAHPHIPEILRLWGLQDRRSNGLQYFRHLLCRPDASSSFHDMQGAARAAI